MVEVAAAAYTEVPLTLHPVSEASAEAAPVNAAARTLLQRRTLRLIPVVAAVAAVTPVVPPVTAAQAETASSL
jgi:hypothetical protein